MRLLTNIAIVIASTLIAFFIFLILVPAKDLNYEDPIKVNEIDSLNKVLHDLNEENLMLMRELDSLKVIKDKVKIIYEKDISNFKDIYIVSDDSIAKYIRSRIEAI